MRIRTAAAAAALAVLGVFAGAGIAAADGFGDINISREVNTDVQLGTCGGNFNSSASSWDAEVVGNCGSASIADN